VLWGISSKRMRKLFIPVALLLTHLAVAQQAPADSSRSQSLKTLPNWFNLDQASDNVRGVSTERAYQELLKGRKSTPVIVGVIDSGTDVNHEDLKSKIWVNPKEIPGNGKDDDKNGYVDDIHGWDFLGGKDGTDVSKEQLELTREYARYKKRFEGVAAASVPAKDQKAYQYYQDLKKEYEEKAQENRMYLAMLPNMLKQYQDAEGVLKKHLGLETLTEEAVSGINTGEVESNVRRAKQVVDRGFQMGYDVKQLEEAVKHYQDEADYNLNLEFDARKVIGDNPEDGKDRNYGNAEVVGPDARHGTHVAGIIGADRNNDLGIKGVADNVQIMVIRAVPDGDERDKDVANAIRYAVDNGAQVINMSFGKAYSPQKELVDAAVKYAASKGVLLVHAAGNEAKNTDEAANFPNRRYLDGKMAENWIEVGALSWKPNQVANFSNYGQTAVDVFAPGVDLYATVPGSNYEELSGTSMASPVVAGVAALLKSYFPTLTAVQIKKIILESADKTPTQQVNLPGGEGPVEFGTLSVTGGVVNVYNAVKMAMSMEKPKQ
jgi:subtilisin family serine protease